ncbi:hypothetical protein BD410DRAFT_636594 [Rickenella mellea]|uniref:Uncharacterized protein n=1 Tax=Rickenella mellea TaxID=50990 RepID=A0A4Y7QEQ2_9AGAM|nr:hypothetical protein BD410DRAFT_636594 [Rickenella mellea]
MTFSPPASLNHHLTDFVVDPQPCVESSAASFSSAQFVIPTVPPTASQQLLAERNGRNLKPCANCKASHLRCVTAPPYSADQCKFCYEHDFSTCPHPESDISRRTEKTGEIKKCPSEDTAAGSNTLEQIAVTSPFDAPPRYGPGPSEWATGLGLSSGLKDTCRPYLPM